MKSGSEAHYVAGQLFTIGVLAMTILPRMASDGLGSGCALSVGGKLSHPYRRALLHLVMLGTFRLFCFHHLLFPFLDLEKYRLLTAFDALLGIVHVIGQSFLCLTTAYLLQCQLANVINLGRPGSNLVPYLIVISVLCLGGALGSSFVHPNLWCLINLAEAISCYPVLRTLRTYTSVTVSQMQHQQRQPILRGPVLTQILTVCEMWYWTTSMISFVAEALAVDDDTLESFHGRPLQLLLVAARHNQDNGVDDWTRLLMHSVFLNCLDELNHVQQAPAEASPGDNHPTSAFSAPGERTTMQSSSADDGDESGQALLVRRRAEQLA